MSDSFTLARRGDPFPLIRGIIYTLAVVSTLLLLASLSSYTSLTLNPLYHSVSATTSHKSEWTTMFAASFIVMSLNTFTGTKMVLWSFMEWGRVRGPHQGWNPALLRPVLAGCYGTMIMLASAFLPAAIYTAPVMEWKAHYAGVCQGRDVRAYLDGPSVHFMNVARSDGFNFSMALNPTPVVDRYGVYNFNVTENSANPPAWTHITYDLGTGYYNVFNNSGLIFQKGIIDLRPKIKIPEMGLTANLEYFQRSCVFDPTVSIVDTGRNRTVARTVRFEICSGLVVCAEESEGSGLGMAVIVGGLVLVREGRGGACCAGGRIPGVEGRES